LDIKRADLAQLAGEIEQHDIARQIILASPHHHLLRQWKARVPKSSTLLWMGGSEAELNGRLAELSELKFADIDQLQIHVHLRIDAHAIARDTSDPFVESDAFLAETSIGLRRWGIFFQVLPYGGSTPAVYWKLLDLGVQSFATDHPDVTWDAVRKYYEAGK